MSDRSWSAIADDGTTAAVGLLVHERLGEVLPPSGYGTIATNGRLTAAAAASFLEGARRASGAQRLLFRTVALPGADAVDWSFAPVTGLASIVEVASDRDHREGFRRLALRSVRKAEAAGADVRTTHDATAFLGLYAEASAAWSMTYSHELIRSLGRASHARFDEVWIDEVPVAALMTLCGASHWMCWLAAQNEQGRAAAASYLAYDAVLRDAASAVGVVSFGASAPGSQGLEFKRRLGAIEVPIHQWETSSVIGRLRSMG